jgi:aminoglycoside 2'-N-acetyltransferase I
VSPTVREVANDDLTARELADLHALVDAAWPGGGFSRDDWDHGMQGPHWVLEVDGRIVSHASLDDRVLRIADRPVRTGYLEMVATLPGSENLGYGSAVVRTAMDFLLPRYELGGLSTGRPTFYERQGWEQWLGRTFVDGPGGREPTPDDDGDVYVLRTPTSPPFDRTEDLVAPWRSGDVW